MRDTARLREWIARLIRSKVPLYLALILLAVWTLFPFYTGAISALSTEGGVGALWPQARHLTTRYVADLIRGDDRLLPPLLNSAVVTLVTIAIVLVLALPAGYGFSRWRGRTSRSVYLLFFVLRMLPPIALVIPWFLIIAGWDLMDTYIGLVITYIPFRLCLGVWLMKGFFDTIPFEIEEAAAIDGASAWQTFTRVILPLSRNGVSVTIVFAGIQSYIEYMYAVSLTRRVTTTLPVFIAAFATPWSIRYQHMLGAALIGTIPMILLFLAAQKQIVRGVTGGMIKG